MRVSIAQRFEELMNYFGVRQTDISYKTGIPKSAISNYVSGVRLPRQDKLTMIAKAYGVTETWLLGYDVPMFPEDQTKKAQEDFMLIKKFSKLNNRDKTMIMNLIDSMLSSYEEEGLN